MKFETAHLVYEHGFVTIIKTDDDGIHCGQIHDDGHCSVKWPRYLGPEPDWLDTEIDELCEMVSDHFDKLDADDRDYRA